METYHYVFCDWTTLDMTGRFFIFCVWGYYMGKSVTDSPNLTWALTFLGVLLCAFIHTWTHFCALPQIDIYDAGLYNESIEAARKELWQYGMKVFVFYLTAGHIGYRAGRQKAKVITAELNRVFETLKKLEAEGLIKEDEADDPRQERKKPVFQIAAWLSNNPFVRKLIRYGARKP